jgi:hypothetical protein
MLHPEAADIADRKNVQSTERGDFCRLQCASRNRLVAALVN